jgi:hypothetical protein
MKTKSRKSTITLAREVFAHAREAVTESSFKELDYIWKRVIRDLKLAQAIRDALK